MIRLLLAASVAISDYLRRYMPTNKIRDRVYTRDGLKWGIPAMLLAIPYFGIALWLARIIETGAPGWLNVAVLICLWCGFKMLWLGPISVVMLIRARIREWAQCYCRCVGEVEINPLKSAADATMGTRL